MINTTNRKIDILTNKIRNMIYNKEMLPGSKIFSQNQMCDKYNVSVNTVREAMATLVQEGLLVRIHGSGTYVADVIPKRRKISVLMPCIIYRIPRENQYDYSHEVHELTSGILGAIENEAISRDMGLNMYLTCRSYDRELLNCKEVLYSGSQAFIGWIDCMSDETRAVISDMVNSGIPVVIVDKDFKIDGTSFVGIDNYKASSLAVEEFYKNGIKNLVFVSDKFDLPTIRDRENGFLETANNLGLNAEIFKCNVADNDFQQLCDFIKEKDSTALLFLNNYICEQFVVQFPDLLENITAMACFDKLSVPVPKIPLYFEIRQPLYDIGKACVDIVEDYFNGNSNPQRKIFSAKIVYV